MHSHHSHSGQFCKHAAGLLENVVLEAIRQGFEVYGLTEHVPRYRDQDLYPEEVSCRSDYPRYMLIQQRQVDLPLEALSHQFDNFLDEAERLKALYASRITLLVGLETEFITAADLDGLEQLLEKHDRRIEYIVGSIHHVNAIPIDFDLPTFHLALNSFPADTADKVNEQRGQFLSAYLDAQYELLRRFRPEIVGHIDLCRMYTPGLRFSDFPDAFERLERNVRFAISYGALFEANAAAFRKGWDTAYPGVDILKASIPIAFHYPLSFHL